MKLAKKASALVIFLLGSCCLSASAAIPQALRDQARNASISPATLGLIGAVLDAFDDGSALNVTDTTLSSLHGNFSSPWQADARLPVSGKEDSCWLEKLADIVGAAFTEAMTSADLHSIPNGSELPEDWQAAASQQDQSQLNPKDSVQAKAVPGITAVVFSDFFKYASGIAVQLLKENFKKVNLESVTAIAHVPVLGDFAIKLENVKLEGLALDGASTGVSLADDGTFVLLVHNLDAVVDGHFQWRRTKFPFISGGAQAQVTAVGGQVKLRVQVLDDGAGRPTIVGMETAQLSFDSISIVTSGAKLSWLYNAVVALAKTPIQAAITREVAAQVSTTVPEQVNKLLLGIPTTVLVKGLELNTSLASDPSVTADRLIVWDWGRFQNPGANFEECPYVRKAGGLQAGPIMPGGGKYMLVANIDESIVNCLTWDLFRKRMLSHFFVGDDIPKRFLYTDTWMLIVPKVYEMCPGCVMALNASVSEPPRTVIDPVRGVVTSGKATLSFFLAEDNHPGEPWTPVQPVQKGGSISLSESETPSLAAQRIGGSREGTGAAFGEQGLTKREVNPVMQRKLLGGAEAAGKLQEASANGVQYESAYGQTNSADGQEQASRGGSGRISSQYGQEQTAPGSSKTGTQEQVGRAGNDSATPGQVLAGSGEQLGVGQHLFTLSLAGELFVHDLRVEHDVPDRPDSWRLALEMKVNQSALTVDVAESDVGDINHARLKLALTIGAFLVEDQVNKGILKDGFPLPDVPHVKVTRANVTVANDALALGSDVKYAG